MPGTTYTVPPIPPDPAHTTWVEGGGLRIGVEYRKVDPEALAATYGDSAADMAEIAEHSPEGGFDDQGISIHVVAVADDHEYVRFDVFDDEPHYHYVDKAAGTNTVVDYDPVAHGAMKPWMLRQLRHGLGDMLRHAGAPDAADAVTAELGAEIADRVEAHLREIGEME